MATPTRTPGPDTASGLQFTCPDWCTMRKRPEDHYGVDEEDLSTVLHYGPNAGIRMLADDWSVAAGFDADRMAGVLPDGSPGRPFLRISEVEDGPHFDIHSIEEGNLLLRSLAHSAYEISRWIELAEQWGEQHGN
ncbi:hypothetical protein AB0H07_40405 [Streptomyces sp. NPDC021354]|uniref:hypothetical protein n=1 Tax=Streptomyces sp. NPDC021354 TaxID=3154793 RepID=UPI0033E39F94